MREKKSYPKREGENKNLLRKKEKKNLLKRGGEEKRNTYSKRRKGEKNY